jgi:hypothetical protein
MLASLSMQPPTSTTAEGPAQGEAHARVLVVERSVLVKPIDSAAVRALVQERVRGR